MLACGIGCEDFVFEDAIVGISVVSAIIFLVASMGFGVSGLVNVVRSMSQKRDDDARTLLIKRGMRNLLLSPVWFSVAFFALLTGARAVGF